MRRLTRDLRARAATYNELPNRPDLESLYQAEIDRIRQRLLELGVDVTDRTQARALLALADVLAGVLDNGGPRGSVIIGAFSSAVLDVVALRSAELELQLPGEDDA